MYLSCLFIMFIYHIYHVFFQRQNLVLIMITPSLTYYSVVTYNMLCPCTWHRSQTIGLSNIPVWFLYMITNLIQSNPESIRNHWYSEPTNSSDQVSISSLFLHVLYCSFSTIAVIPIPGLRQSSAYLSDLLHTKQKNEAVDSQIYAPAQF